MVVSLLMSGCGISYGYRAGDMRVHETRTTVIGRELNFGVTAKRDVDFKFPEVSLGSAQTTTFRVRGYPAEMSPMVRLDLPENPRASNVIGQVLPWHRCVLDISVLGLDGAVLGSQRVQLGELHRFKDSGYLAKTYVPSWGQVFVLLDVQRAIRRRADYDLRMTVQTPSSDGSDVVRVTGESQEW